MCLSVDAAIVMEWPMPNSVLRPEIELELYRNPPPPKKRMFCATCACLDFVFLEIVAIKEL